MFLYCISASMFMAKSEKWKMIKGFMFLFVSACHAGFNILCDFGLFWLLMMIQKHMAIKTETVGKWSKGSNTGARRQVRVIGLFLFCFFELLVYCQFHSVQAISRLSKFNGEDIL